MLESYIRSGVSAMDYHAGITIVCTMLAVLLSYLGFSRNQKKDNAEEGRSAGVILSELGYIKSGVEDIKAEQREQRKINTEFYSRLSAVESSSKQAHKRIDTLEGIRERTDH